MDNKEEKTEEILTVEDIAEMSVEEVKDSLLFQSYFSTEHGPMCECRVSKLDRFHAYLPDALCEKSLEEVDLNTVKDFETSISTVCPCQVSHFFELKLKAGVLTYTVSTGQICDNRRLRLPNYR